jgi:hypothetical protein
MEKNREDRGRNGWRGAVMDMVFEGAGTRRGDDEEPYEDEDHVYTFMYSCQIELKSQPSFP